MPMNMALSRFRPGSTLGAALLGAGATIVALGLGFLARRLRWRPHRFPAAPKGPGSREAKIILVDFPPAQDLVSGSPFVVKLEAWLRFAGLAYEKKRCTPADFAGAPKGKLPIIIHGDMVVPDSHLIIQYLSRTYGGAVERAAAPEDARSRALDTALRLLAEGHMYYCAIHIKYGANWDTVAREFRGMAGQHWGMSWPVRELFLISGRPRIYNQCVAQGIGRFTDAEVCDMMDEALSSLSATLGDQPFLLGDRPYEADAAVFGTLHVLLHHKGAVPELAEIVRRYPNLVAYEERIQATYFGEAYKPTLVPGGSTNGAMEGPAAALKKEE